MYYYRCGLAVCPEFLDVYIDYAVILGPKQPNLENLLLLVRFGCILGFVYVLSQKQTALGLHPKLHCKDSKTAPALPQIKT